MVLLGKGAMVTWHDALAAGGADFNEWHSKEHLAERVGVPGFLRGYRFVALAGAPKYFILYEVEELAILTSQPYLDRLNHPTPWTRRSMATFRNNNRTLCRVLASFGQAGVPGFMGTLQLGPAAGRAEELRAHLVGTRLPELVAQPGLLAAHLLEGDQAASGMATEEKRLRGIPDRTADLAVLLAGYDPDAIGSALAGPLAATSLAAHGASRPRPTLQPERLQASISGLTTFKPRNRRKSRSAVQSSLTPWLRQSAAMCASWTRGPVAWLCSKIARRMGQ
jgi:hypothetical protein